MFFFFALIAAIAYALQSSLLAHFSRKIGGVQTSTLRSISFIITLTPLLLLSPVESILQVPMVTKELLFASIFAAISNLAAYTAFQYLAIGISNGIRQSIHAVSLILLSFFFFGETLTKIQIILIALIIIALFVLGFSKHNHKHLDNSQKYKGILLTTLAGFSIAISFFFMIEASRILHPFVVGYFWEAIIAVFSVFFFLFRYKKSPFHNISKKDFATISLYSFPTIFGTGLFAYAVTIGPANISAALLATASIFTVIFGYLIYKEKLSTIQICAIIMSVAAIIGLKLL